LPKLSQDITKAIAISSLVLLLLLSALHFAGARFNPSKSVAVGLYWKVNKPIEKGAYVLVCPPDTNIFKLARARGYLGAGFCPGHYSGMMKWIAASAGDEIHISPQGIVINGAFLAYSRPLAQDPGGRPLPQLKLSHYRLAENELLLMGDASSTSFDGRYFGLVDRAQVKGVVRPVWTW